MKKIELIIFLLTCTLGLAQENYSLQMPKSTLQISGTSIASDRVVTTEQIGGDLNVIDEKIINLEVYVPAEAIKSERGATLDSEVHSALKKDEHLRIIFVFGKQGSESILTGELTIAGVSKAVGIEVDYNIKDEEVHIKGKKPLKLKDFGMEPPSAMFGQIVVGEGVTVNFDLHFSKK